MGDDEHRPRRAAIAGLGGDVVRRALGQEGAAKPARAVLEVVDQRGRDHRGESAAQPARAQRRRHHGQCAEHAERDPVGPVRSLLLDDRRGAEVAQRAGDPLGGPALAVRRGRALEARQVADGSFHELAVGAHERQRGY